MKEALSALISLGLPKAQQNERSALTLLALLNLGAASPWRNAESPLIGITPIMDWIRRNYGKDYAPNTRETIRRQTIHQFVQAGIAVENPDEPGRPVNSPHTVYQIEFESLTLLRKYGTGGFDDALAGYRRTRTTLADKYSHHREMEKVPLRISGNTTVRLSPGAHSDLIRKIWEEFGSRFTPGGSLVYAGDTGSKYAYYDKTLLTKLGVAVDDHGKMPDVLIHHRQQNWLVLAEAVTSHGPVGPKRHAELMKLFGRSKAGLVFLTAFPDKKTFSKYIDAISWETEVWIADNPTHLIHFDGERFLGPYKS